MGAWFGVWRVEGRRDRKGEQGGGERMDGWVIERTEIALWRGRARKFASTLISKNEEVERRVA